MSGSVRRARSVDGGDRVGVGPALLHGVSEHAVQEGQMLADRLPRQALALLGDEVLGDHLRVDALQRPSREERDEVLAQHDGVVLERGWPTVLVLFWGAPDRGLSGRSFPHRLKAPPLVDATGIPLAVALTGGGHVERLRDAVVARRRG
jgi:hypothetical protein